MASGIDWDAAERRAGQRLHAKRYSQTTCPICGRTISEGAWGSRNSNLARHVQACARRAERGR